MNKYVGKSVNVVISTVVDPNQFYAIPEVLLDNESYEIAFQKEIQTYAKQSIYPRDEIKVGQVYLVQHQLDQQWYRAKILHESADAKSNVFSRSFRTLLIDYGKFALVEDCFVKECRLPYSSVEPQCCECSLVNVHDYIQEAILLFKFLVSKRKRFEMIVKKAIDGTLMVELMTVGLTQNFAISDCIKSVNSVSIEPIIMLNKKNIPELKLSSTKPEFVTIRHFTSPSEFYVSLINLEDEKEIMNVEMQAFYEQNPVNFTLLAPGVFCATEHINGSWHRVEVLTAPDSDGCCKVQYIDNGETETVGWEGLYELNQQFYENHRFALRCSLAGVEPINDDATWTDAEIKFMKKQLIDCEQYIELTMKPDGVELAILIENGPKIDINNSLVLFKHAKRSDECKPPSLPVKFNSSVDFDPSFNDKLYPIELMDQHNFNISNFRFRYIEYLDALELMTGMIFDKFKSKKADMVEWKAGDKCLVLHSVGEEDYKMFHRGFITAIEPEIQVKLLDHDEEFATTCESLYICPQEFLEMGPTVTSAYLACFKEEWQAEDENKVQEIINSHEQFYIKFKDNNKIQLLKDQAEPRPAILYGRTLNGRKRSIVHQLAESKLVRTNFIDFADLDKDSSEVSLTERMQMWFDSDKNDLKYDLPENLDGNMTWIGDYRVFLSFNRSPWASQKPMCLSFFHVMLTHVDENGYLVGHLEEQVGDLIKINYILNLYMKNKVLSKKTTFKVGAPCLAKFKNDHKFYRATVTAVDEKSNTYSIEYIDYGTVSTKTPANWICPETICSEIPPFAMRFRLEDHISDLSSSFYDKLHGCIVDHHAFVTIHDDDVNIEDPEYVKRCKVKCRGFEVDSYHNVIDFLSNFDYVAPSEGN